MVIAASRHDEDKGVYVALPFLAGTRPSEQLGLMWEDVDFDGNVIRIRRAQMRDGSLSEVTKTAAGARSIPMSPLLREMLLECASVVLARTANSIACSPPRGTSGHGPCRATMAAGRCSIIISARDFGFQC